MPLGMTVLQSGVAGEEMTRRDAVFRKRKGPTTFVERAYADTRGGGGEGPGKMRSSFHGRRVGAGDYQLASSLLPLESSSHRHCSSRPPAQFLARLKAPKLS